MRYEKKYNYTINPTSVILKNKFKLLFHFNSKNTQKNTNIKFNELLNAKISQSISFYLELVEDGKLDVDLYKHIKKLKISNYKSLLFKIFGDLYNKFKNGNDFNLTKFVKLFLRQNYELYESYYKQRPEKLQFLEYLKIYLF